MLTDSQAVCVTHNGIIIHVTKSDYRLLAVGRVWEVYTSLQVPSLPNELKKAVLPLKTKGSVTSSGGIVYEGRDT